MKIRYVVGLTLMLPLAVMAKTFEQCGTERETILHELAQQIYVSVDSRSSQEVEVSGQVVEKNKQVVEKRLSSNVRFQNVTWTTLDQELCASVTTKDMADQWQATNSQVNGYSVKSLPKDRRKKVMQLEAWMDDLAYLLGTYPVLAKEVRLGESEKDYFKRINTTLAELVDERAKTHLQYVRIIVKDEEPATIRVNDVVKASGEEVWLSVGRYNYSVISYDNKYSKTGTFDLAPNGAEQIEVSFTFDRNKDAAFASTGEVFAATGKAIGGSWDWLTSKDDERKKQLTDVANSYKNKSQRIELSYSFAQPGNDFDKFERAGVTRLSLMNYRGVVRYGFGVGYGQAKEAKVTEAYATLMLQIPTLGAGGSPLHIRSIAIVPAFGVDIGVGSSEIYRDGTKISSFAKAGEDKDDFMRDNVIFRPKVTVDFVLLPELAIVAGYEWNTRMDQSRGFNLGLNVKF